MKVDKRQVHRIELIVKLENEDVREWIDGVYEHNDKIMFQSSPSTIVSSDSYPLDLEQPENKWIKDILNESKT